MTVSRKNVENGRRAMRAFNGRDVSAFVGLITEDFEWFPSMVSVVEGGAFRGPEGVEAYFRESANTWPELRVVGEDFRDLGERVVVLGRTEGSGRASGVPASTEIGMVFDLREGKLACVRAYLDYEDTLRAAGLGE